MSNSGHPLKINGFTLLELLIAMAVFAIMSVIAYSGLKVLLDARSQTTLQSAQLADLQMALSIINEDLGNAVPRAVRDGYGTQELALHGGEDGELLTMTRSVPAWSDVATASQLQRISYKLEQGVLYRYAWTTLDRSQNSTPTRRKLLPMEHLQVQFFDTDWTPFWASNTLPKAVEMRFTGPGLGEIKRLFYLHS